MKLNGRAAIITGTSSNIGGGIAAILAFSLLTVVSSYVFFDLLVLSGGLIFGQKVFAGKPTSAIFGTAFSTFLLILGNVISLTGEAGEKVWTRVFQIGIAVMYLVTAFRIVDFITNTYKKHQDGQ